jgi:FkbM family methyltransferase
MQLWVDKAVVQMREVTLTSSVGTARAIVTSETDHLFATWRRGKFYEAAMLEHIWCSYGGKGQVFVDCGSSIGNHTLFFAKFCCSGVVSVEPVKKSLDLQKKVIALNGLTNVQPLNFALSDRVGKGRMEKLLPNSPAWNQGMWRLVEGKGDIEVRTVDSIIQSLNIPRVALVKIDVEFSELKVLRGAMQTIRRDHPVVFVEVTDKTRQNVSEFMTGFGYLEIGKWNASPTYEYMWGG